MQRAGIEIQEKLARHEMKRTITQYQYDSYLAIKDLIEKKCPVRVTLSDIAERLELANESSAHGVVDGLIQSGYLKRMGRKKYLQVVD